MVAGCLWDERPVRLIIISEFEYTMKQIEQGIFYEDVYLGVTLGALILPHGVVMVDAPLRPEDARSWKSLLLN